MGLAQDEEPSARLCCIKETMRRMAALVVVLASLTLAPSAAAALVPHLDRRVAEPGERVTVTLGSGVELFPAPLHVYLVPIGRESARDWHIKTVRAGPYGFIPPPQRLRFPVPAVPPDRYTLAILVRTNGGTWSPQAPPLVRCADTRSARDRMRGRWKTVVASISSSSGSPAATSCARLTATHRRSAHSSRSTTARSRWSRSVLRRCRTILGPARTYRPSDPGTTCGPR
jgi:hypothetical protein